MRISTSAERPTVSVQNGRPICLRNSTDSAWSSSEKNGFGPGGGMSEIGRKSTTRPSFSCAIRLTSACSGSCAWVFESSISAAMSRTTAADRFCVTRFQCRSMKTNATTDCRITIGAMMMSSERA